MILNQLTLLQKAKETPTTLANNFGTIILKTDDSEIIDAIYHLIFSVDFSGSMGTVGNDGKTALEHAKTVIRNILTHLNTLGVEVFITIRLFDNAGLVICEQRMIDDASVREIMEALAPILPRGSTNIKQACAYAKSKVMADARNSHILLTDGCPYSDSTWTIGQGVLQSGGTTKDSANAMANHIYTEMPEMDNYLIGLGSGVNSLLLKALDGKPTGCGYHFVDNVELAGMVYGEITYEIFHDSVRNVTMQVEGDCRVYNWQTNTWSNETAVGNLSAGKEYRVSVRIPWETENICVTCKYLEGDDTVTDELVCQDYKRDEACNVDARDLEIEKWMWRQKTLALLHRSNTNPGDIVETALDTLLTNMRAWMTTKDLVADVFMIQLCTDITNTLSDLRVPVSAAATYRCARISSQGQQRAFRVGAAAPAAPPPRPSFAHRGSSAPFPMTFRGGGMPRTAAPMTPPRPQLGGRGTSAYTNPSQRSWIRAQTQS